MQYNPPINAEKLRPHYNRSLKEDVVLLSAHSHRAWPNCIVEGQMQAVELAFDLVDRKWNKVFGEIFPEFQNHVAQRIGTDRADLIANGENTHELVGRLLSCFPWNNSTHIVTTNSEFYSLRRQLFRLEEEGVDIEYVSTSNKVDLAERIADVIGPETNLVCISTVFFNGGYVLQDLNVILEKARSVNAVVLLDAYHQFNVRQMQADKWGRDIFITSAAYKYASAGEGAAWMKIPENCQLRPVITGWYADFGALEVEAYPKPVNYGDNANRFFGGTRDISGICRQNAVFRFMDQNGLNVETLEENNLHQTAYLIHLFDFHQMQSMGPSLVSSRNDVERGPFLTIDLGNTENAHEAYVRLWEEFKVLTDTRGSILRIGPAPYTTKTELEFCMKKLAVIIDEQ